jgi:6-phosphogluconolactonase
MARSFAWLAMALVVAVFAGPLSSVRPQEVKGTKGAKMDKLWVYVGTYTNKGSKGIYRLELDLASGKLSEPELAGATANPSFLAIHPTGRFLYAVGEYGSFGGKKTGGVSAFALDGKTGKLTLLNQRPSGGAGPCHIVVDKPGKNVLVANYGGGSAAALPIQTDGKLAVPSSIVQHKGSSVNKQRQEAPHAHCARFDPANRFAFIVDLGLDKVMIYRFDGSDGTLTANDPPAGEVKPGAGPRHFTFHPKGRFAYVINELDSTVTAFTYDAEKGTLTSLQTVTTLPEGAKATNYPAEIVVHPSGKFLYGSNRGHDSIAIFTLDSQTGKLTAAGHQAEGIKTPRNFNIDPTGRYLIVANQGSDSLIVFAIDQESGALRPTGSRVTVPTPVCVQFLTSPK